MISWINIKKISAATGIGFLFLLPVFVAGQSIVPKQNNTGITYDCQNENPGQPKPGECTFQDLIKAVQKVVKWGTIFALEFSVVVIAYAGFTYMTSGNNPGKRAEANTMLKKVLIGIGFILGAWLIVTLITNGLLLKPEISTFLK